MGYHECNNWLPESKDYHHRLLHVTNLTETKQTRTTASRKIGDIENVQHEQGKFEIAAAWPKSKMATPRIIEQTLWISG